MSKITLALFILFCLRVQAEVAEGDDPNMPMRNGGANVCINGECNTASGFDQLGATANDAKALKDAISGKSNKYRLQKGDAALSPEELEEKRREAIKANLNTKDIDEAAEKVKKGMNLRDGISTGETTIGGAKVKLKGRPTKGGLKIKAEGEF